jgi:hypothetical protein
MLNLFHQIEQLYIPNVSGDVKSFLKEVQGQIRQSDEVRMTPKTEFEYWMRDK